MPDLHLARDSVSRRYIHRINNAGHASRAPLFTRESLHAGRAARRRASDRHPRFIPERSVATNGPAGHC